MVLPLSKRLFTVIRNFFPFRHWYAFLYTFRIVHIVSCVKKILCDRYIINRIQTINLLLISQIHDQINVNRVIWTSTQLINKFEVHGKATALVESKTYLENEQELRKDINSSLSTSYSLLVVSPKSLVRVVDSRQSEHQAAPYLSIDTQVPDAAVEGVGGDRSGPAVVQVPGRGVGHSSDLQRSHHLQPPNARCQGRPHMAPLPSLARVHHHLGSLESSTY